MNKETCICNGEVLCWYHYILNVFEDDKTSTNKIEQVVLGEPIWYLEKSDIPEYPSGKLLSWEQAIPYLKAFLDPNCSCRFEGPPLYVWTTEHIYITATYDSRFWLEKIPRNPTNCTPEYIGM